MSTSFYSISERREILKAQYHFACDCASCNRQDLVEFQERFSALRCHHCGGPIQNPTSEAALAHSMPCFDCGKIQVSFEFFYVDNYTCIELPHTDNSKVLKCMNLTCLIKAKLANKTPL